MRNILHHYKPLIDKKVKELSALTHGSNVPWAEDVGQRLLDFTTRGKSVRGSLFLFTVDLFHPPHDETAVSIAAALEILHTALLIHDDIVDHDKLRRGVPTFHKQYQEWGQTKRVLDPQEFGKAMALCAGDIAIFGAFSFLASLSLPSPIHKNLLQTATREFLLVGFGELHDIALGYTPEIPSPKEVIAMYRHKTARYTFSLPMMLGAIVTGQKKADIKQLEKLGETLGLLFQITDDVLTLSGYQEIVGKTVGNDIAENKNTLYKVLLFEKMNTEDKQTAMAIFGKPNVGSKELTTVQTLIAKYNVDQEIQNYIHLLETDAKKMIEKLPLPDSQKKQFLEIVQFLKDRKA